MRTVLPLLVLFLLADLTLDFFFFGVLEEDAIGSQNGLDTL